eukprot:6802990-Pyramimonas_sp.AAC.1
MRMMIVVTVIAMAMVMMTMMLMTDGVGASQPAASSRPARPQCIQQCNRGHAGHRLRLPRASGSPCAALAEDVQL